MQKMLFTSSLYIISSFLGFIILLGIAVVSVLKGGRKRTNYLFAGICLLGALLNIDVAIVFILANEEMALCIDRFVHFLFVFSLPVYISFVHAFLEIHRRRWLEKISWILSIAFSIFVPTNLYINGFHYYSFGRIARAGPLVYLFSAVTFFTVSYCLAVLYSAMSQASDNSKRNRIKYIFGGLGFTSILLFFTVLPVIGIPVYPLGNLSFIPALFLAYGVIKYDLLDIGVLLRRGTVYFVLTGLLTVLYVPLIFLFHSFFMSSFSGNFFILSIVLAIVIVFFFNPLQEWVQKLVYHFFFRGRYNYHSLLRDISGQLTSLLSLRQIEELLIKEMTAAMQVERLMLVIKEEGVYQISGHNESGNLKEDFSAGFDLLERILEYEKKPLNKNAILERVAEEGNKNTLEHLFDCLGVTIVIPIPAAEESKGMIFLGQKKSGELFVDEDLEILMTIANQAATAMENARSYEALEVLNRDLETKVEERTEALKKALLERERTEEQLIRSESLSAIGQLVAGVAHELNNPIAGAMSLVETSVDTVSEWEVPRDTRDEVIDDLRFSIKELRRSAAIIRSLLDLSRQTPTYVEPVEMNRVIDDAVRVLYNQYKNLSVTIEKNYADDLPTVEGNFAGLGQVMINIIQNAIQSMLEEKGAIKLRTGYKSSADAVFVECADNGAGIPEAALRNIFKPFFTTKKVGRGTGLGLYISYEIIRRHGGMIDVKSKEGKGTVVYLEIPCRRRDS